MNRALNIVRRANLWVSTQSAAIMLGKSLRWVQENKNHQLLRYRRKGTRNLEFELSSVLALEEKLNAVKDAA